MLINIMFMPNNSMNQQHYIWLCKIKNDVMPTQKCSQFWFGLINSLRHIQSTSLLQKLLSYRCLDLHIMQHFIYFLVIVTLTEIHVLHRFPYSNSRERSLTTLPQQFAAVHAHKHPTRHTVEEQFFELGRFINVPPEVQTDYRLKIRYSNYLGYFGLPAFPAETLNI